MPFAIAATAGILVATAFATGLADRFGAWVTGTPGRPAPPGLQHGFEELNRAAYAAFPAGTKLRLLLSRTVSGTTFSLLGFRNGDAYCLRLIRTDHPDAIGRNECLRAEELSGVPALVTGDVWFSVGDPAKNINGVYGFAADDVRSLVVERLRGADRVPVVNNVFLSLARHACRERAEPPGAEPGRRGEAVLRNGSTAQHPVCDERRRRLPGGKRPTGPFYFSRAPGGLSPARRR